MASEPLKSFAEVQALLSANSGPAASAPHQLFWEALTYEQFVSGNVPDHSGGVYGGPPSITNPPFKANPPSKGNPPVKILVKGHSDQSNIILALSGLPPFDGSVFNQMPDNAPHYFTQDQINQLAGWIDAGCPEFATKQRSRPARKPSPSRRK